MLDAGAKAPLVRRVVGEFENSIAQANVGFRSGKFTQTNKGTN